MDLDRIMKKNEKGEEVYDMCQAFEDYKEEGRLEGRSEGEISAFRHSIEKVMKKMQMTFEEAAEFLELPKTEQKKLQILM